MFIPAIKNIQNRCHQLKTLNVGTVNTVHQIEASPVSHSQFFQCVCGIELQQGSGGVGSGSGGGSGSSFNYLNVDNCLFSRVGAPIAGTDLSGGSGYTALQNVKVYNSTFDQASTPVTLDGGAPGSSFFLTLQAENSLFANITSGASSGVTFSGKNNGFYNNGFTSFGASPFVVYSSPFQTVGGGGYDRLLPTFTSDKVLTGSPAIHLTLAAAVLTIRS